MRGTTYKQRTGVDSFTGHPVVRTLLVLGTGHRGVAGDVHGEDEQHAEVGQDVAADVEDAGVVPAPTLSYARPRDGSPDL